MQVLDADRVEALRPEETTRTVGVMENDAAVVFSCRMHGAPVVALAVSEKAQRVASLGMDGSIALLELTHRPSGTKSWKFLVSCVTSVSRM